MMSKKIYKIKTSSELINYFRFERWKLVKKINIERNLGIIRFSHNNQRIEVPGEMGMMDPWQSRIFVLTERMTAFSGKRGKKARVDKNTP